MHIKDTGSTTIPHEVCIPNMPTRYRENTVHDIHFIKASTGIGQADNTKESERNIHSCTLAFERK